MLTAPPTDADAAIAMLLADPRLAPLVVAHREIEPRPPRHAPWPKGLDRRLVEALRATGIEAPFTHQAAAYDAAVVDVMLPRLDGLSLVTALRRAKVATPVLFLSARHTVDDRGCHCVNVFASRERLDQERLGAHVRQEAQFDL